MLLGQEAFFFPESNNKKLTLEFVFSKKARKIEKKPFYCTFKVCVF